MRILKQMYPDQDAGSQAVTDEKVLPKESKTTIEGLDIEIPNSLFDSDDDQTKTQEDTPIAEPVKKAGEPNIGQLPQEFAERYKDKSPDDLLKILYDSQKQIGKLGQKIGETKEDPLNDARKSISELSSDIEKLKKTLESEYDSEFDKDTPEYQKQQREIERKEKKIRELKDKEQELLIEKLVNKKVYDSYNQEFLKQQRNETAKTLGMESIDDEIWDNITDYAQHIAGSGEKLTTEDIHAATIKTLGFNTYNKIVSTQAKLNVRDEIAKAAGKTVANIGGKQVGTMRFEEMTDAQHEKVLDHLYATDRAMFEQYTKRYLKLRKEREQ